MTAALLSILASGAQKMAQTDPHGWTLSLVSVTVVFCALLILFCLFYGLGRLFRLVDARKEAARSRFLASLLERGDDEQARVAAAIATALDLYLSDCVHDAEPGVVTFREDARPWGDKTLTFRKTPRK